MNYWLTEPAKNDLVLIWQYTADRWNEAQADNYIDAMEVRFAWLTQNQKLWKPRPEIIQGLFSHSEHSHVSLFRKRRQSLEILRVLHRRMDIETHL